MGRRQTISYRGEGIRAVKFQYMLCLASDILFITVIVVPHNVLSVAGRMTTIPA